MEGKMTDELKIGDRVNVKVEYQGEVTQIGNEYVMVDDEVHGENTYALHEIEKIRPPLPWKPGAVIRSGGFVWFKSRQGWYSNIDNSPWNEDDDFEGSVYAKNFEIVIGDDDLG